jgi:hypothetical protein
MELRRSQRRPKTIFFPSSCGGHPVSLDKHVRDDLHFPVHKLTYFQDQARKWRTIG